MTGMAINAIKTDIMTRNCIGNARKESIGAVRNNPNTRMDVSISATVNC